MKFVKKKWYVEGKRDGNKYTYLRNLPDLLTRLACHPVRVRMLLSAIMGYARREKSVNACHSPLLIFYKSDNSDCPM